MRAIILLGPPGAGKGTQAERLAAALGVAHISTGAILRQAAAEGTPLGLEARRIMQAGDLVSDELVLGIVEERVGADDCRGGFILDGYPRNRAQAEALDDLLRRLGADPAVVNIAVPSAELESRIRLRRLDTGREDDAEAAVRRRLAIHEAESRPLLDHYRGRVSEISGLGSRDEVFERLQERIFGEPVGAGVP